MNWCALEHSLFHEQGRISKKWQIKRTQTVVHSKFMRLGSSSRFQDHLYCPFHMVTVLVMADT